MRDKIHQIEHARRGQKIWLTESDVVNIMEQMGVIFPSFLRAQAKIKNAALVCRRDRGNFLILFA